MKRLQFTSNCRPKNNDIIMLCTKQGEIWCGVVSYPSKIDYELYGEECMEQLSISMFVNDEETEGSVEFENIRWWHLLPLTKKELYSGNAFLNK